MPIGGIVLYELTQVGTVSLEGVPSLELREVPLNSARLALDLVRRIDEVVSG